MFTSPPQNKAPIKIFGGIRRAAARGRGIFRTRKISGLQKSIPAPTVHFVGIGGIGISSLARWFLTNKNKWNVSGSDLTPNRITRELKTEGARIFVGHKKTNVPKTATLVVYSQAIGKTNPELVETRRNNIPCFSYPEAVGELTKSYETIATAGAHGKSTTTALIGLILKNANLDPTIIVGTELKELGGKNFRLGKSKYLVLEADEWRAAFLNYSPTISVITNIDREHLDFYKNLETIKKTFLAFMARTKSGGNLILNKDNKILALLAQRIKKNARGKKFRIAWYSIKNPIAKQIRKIIKIPGDHNVSNAVGAYTAGKLLGIPSSKILHTISAYTGSWRRFEYRGNFHPQHSTLHIPTYDDYAHHPTEIKATLQGFKEKFPERNIICVFQPHQGKRLRSLFKEFVRAFDAADTIVITPIYKVPGRDEKIAKQFSPETLVRTMQKKYPRKPIFYLSDFKNLKNALQTLVTEPYVCGLPKDSTIPKIKPAVIVMMGAGDIAGHTNSLIK